MLCGRSQVRAKVAELTDDVGADLCVDAAGFVATVENAVWCTRRAGRMVQVGLPLQVEPNVPMWRVAGRELEIIGSHGMAASDFPAILKMVGPTDLSFSLFFSLFSRSFFAPSFAHRFSRILQVAEGRLRPQDLVEREVSLEEGAKAIEAMEGGSPLGITMVTSF